MQHSILIDSIIKNVEVVFKDIKTVRLKVLPDGRICLSVPADTPADWIVSFLNAKTPWIEQKIQAFEETKGIEREEHIRSGASTRILGKQRVIIVEEAKQKRIFLEGRKLVLQTTCPDNQADLDKQFNNWWQKTSKDYFLSIVESLFPIIQRHGIEKPGVSVKKMATLWGSCSRKAGKINLNFYLYKAPVPCVEYVILHEMAHFLYPKHNHDFYNFISVYMPDWKERKDILDYETVLGL